MAGRRQGGGNGGEKKAQGAERRQKNARAPEKRDGGQKNGACGAGNARKKRGRGFLGGPRAKHSVWGEGAPYGTVINDAMEAHRDAHTTHSIQPNLHTKAPPSPTDEKECSIISGSAQTRVEQTSLTKSYVARNQSFTFY